jgi:class 3 adenylate cyclase
MEPQIQYVRSADGTRIAMSTIGRGRPFVIDYGVAWATMEAQWEVPQWRNGLEHLAKRRMVVVFDGRGCGLSDREVQDFSIEARVNDLAAIVSSLSAHIDLMGMWWGSQAAMSYAAANPVMVRHLILRNPTARGNYMRPTSLQRALRTLIEPEWPTYIRSIILEAFGWEVGQRIERAALNSIAPAALIAAGRAAREYDVSDILSNIRCPTLLLRDRNQTNLSLEAFKEVTEAIPGARLVQYDGGSPLVLSDEAAVRIIEQFLDEDDGDRQREAALPSGTAVILFADIADSTALTERLGDAAFRGKARDLNATLRKVIRDIGGSLVEGPTLGDGLLATFRSAREAIGAALVCARSGVDAGLPLHLGLHAGDVTREKDPDGRDNVYGGAVNVASRISGLSAPGEVLVSGTVRDLARTSAGVSFEDRGEQALKGVGEPVRVWAVAASE